MTNQAVDLVKPLHVRGSLVAQPVIGLQLLSVHGHVINPNGTCCIVFYVWVSIQRYDNCCGNQRQYIITSH
jgi:hypothetical protein